MADAATISTDDEVRLFDTLTGTQKSAILMMLLGEDEAAEILKNLSPREVQHLGAAMYSVQGVDQQTVNLVLDEFLAIIKQQTSIGLGAGNYIRNVLTKALGGDKAQSVLSRITPASSERPIDILDWMDARSIAELIIDEHPQIVALIISYLDDLGIGRGQHPFLGACKKRIGGDHLIDQPGRFGRFRVKHLALEQHGRCGHRADHARIPRRAAAAGEQAHEDLGQADLGLGIVGHEAAVTGERDLGADARAGAGDGDGHRLAALVGLGVHPRALKLAQDAGAAHGEIKQRLRRIIARLGRDTGQRVQIHPACEGVLARGQHDTLDAGVAERVIDQLIDQRIGFARQHIHRTCLDVPSDDGNAVGALLHREIGHLALILLFGSHAGIDRGVAVSFVGSAPGRSVVCCVDLRVALIEKNEIGIAGFGLQLAAEPATIAQHKRHLCRIGRVQIP